MHVQSVLSSSLVCRKRRIRSGRVLGRLGVKVSVALLTCVRNESYDRLAFVGASDCRMVTVRIRVGVSSLISTTCAVFAQIPALIRDLYSLDMCLAFEAKRNILLLFVLKKNVGNVSPLFRDSWKTIWISLRCGKKIRYLSTQSRSKVCLSILGPIFYKVLYILNKSMQDLEEQREKLVSEKSDLRSIDSTESNKNANMEENNVLSRSGTRWERLGSIEPRANDRQNMQIIYAAAYIQI